MKALPNPPIFLCNEFFTLPHIEEKLSSSRKQFLRAFLAFSWLLHSEGLGRDISPEAAWKLALLVKDKLAELHPEIPIDQHDHAIRETLQRAYASLVPANKEPAPENPAGYLWSVLSSGAAIDDYLPWEYVIGAN